MRGAINCTLFSSSSSRNFHPCIKARPMQISQFIRYLHAKGNIELGGNISFGLLVIQICLKMFVTHDIQKELFFFGTHLKLKSLKSEYMDGHFFVQGWAMHLRNTMVVVVGSSGVDKKCNLSLQVISPSPLSRSAFF